MARSKSRKGVDKEDKAEEAQEEGSKSLKETFEACKNNEEKLKKLLQSTEAEEISRLIAETAGDSFGYTFWSKVIAFLKDEDKLFEVVKEVLPKLNRDELSTKVLNDFYSRLNIDISSFSLNFAVNLAYFCENHMQFGDPRAPFFKDILPCVLQVLAKDDRTITIDGITQPSGECHQAIIKGILSKPFKVSVLTSITSMFKDIPLNKLQTEQLMGKICENFSNVPPSDIGGLAHACFNLALFHKLVIPVLALDTYFFQKRYKKKYIELDSASDLNSIDEFSEKGIVETEETVIFHFQHVTEFTSIEKDIVNSLRPLAFAPKFIISPFIATILVSFAKMSSSSVGSNLRLPQSILLPFLKQVFKNNERHRAILHSSAWARSVDQFDPVDIEKLLTVLQENTCKLGQNVALNGFIGLTFMLLKTKNAPALNSFAVEFLNELVKQRQEFTSDIMKIVVKMLFSESNKAPIIDCFSRMIQNHSLAIDRCEEALTELIENLTELQLDTALAIESVIFSSITKSTKLRDLMTISMRNAMYQNQPGLRKLAVYSFCVMLKKVTKPSNATQPGTSFGTTQNISLMSLMSQSQLPPTEKASMRKVSVMVLEILGLLRKCFSHGVEIRTTLYESLLVAVTANPFIIPNVLELIEPYFRDYFDCETDGIVVNFPKAFKQHENGDVVVMDHMGRFLHFFIGCLQIAQDKIDDANIQMENYQRIIEKLMDRIVDVTMQQLDVFTTLNSKVGETITQFLNCLEALMVYCFNHSTNTANITRLKKLFEKHGKFTAEALKLQENSKKSMKKGKNQSTEPAPPKVDISFECIWDFNACGDFLKLCFNDTDDEKLIEIQQNEEFLRFVLKSMSRIISQLATAPEYLKIKHSRSTAKSLLNFSKVIYGQLALDKFTVLFERFDSESAAALAETFKNAVTVMDSIYNVTKKWHEFLRAITKSPATASADKMIADVISSIQKVIEWAYTSDRDVLSEANGEKVVLNLFLTLELLNKNFQKFPNPHTRDIYNWMLKFCKEMAVQHKDLHIINKIFFQVMVQFDSGNTMMEHIAHKISGIYGYLDEDFAEPADASQNDLKSIDVATVDQTFFHFAAIIKKQIDDIEFCISRMNSFNAHVKIPGQDSRNESISAMASLEMSIVVKLTQLARVVGRLFNTRFNLRGNHIETIGRVGINYFTCLCNLVRHFTQHFDLKRLNFAQIPLEQLMKETRVTVKQSFGLSPYIEDMIKVEQEQRMKDGKKKPAPNKEFKYMSRHVLQVEKFSSYVQKLDLLTKKNFSRYSHTGDVRDFRIESERIAGPTNDISGDESDERSTLGSANQVESDSESEAPVRASKRSRPKPMEDSSDEAAFDSDATDASKETPIPIVRGGFEKNLEAMNKKAKLQAKKKKK